MSAVDRLGEHRAPGRGHSSAKAPKREPAEHTGAQGGSCARSPEKPEGQWGQMGKDLQRDRPRGLDYVLRSLGSHRRVFKQGGATDRLPLREPSLWLQFGGRSVAGEVGKRKSVAGGSKGSRSHSEKRPFGKAPQNTQNWEGGMEVAHTGLGSLGGAEQRA